MSKTTISLLSPFLLLGALAAQTTYVAPMGFGAIPAGGGNSIPLWAGSFTYMQVHDAADLTTVFPAPVANIRAISFRVPINGTITARTMDLQITMGTTPVTASAATNVFATNLGPSPQIVRPYAVLNLPTVGHISIPNPQGWFFPLQTPYLYTTAQGNLCFELRARNLSRTGDMFEELSGSDSVVRPLIGTGCKATGQTVASTITSRSLAMGSGAWVNQLDRGAVNAAAVMLVGVTPLHVALPGLCGALETNPLVTIPGTTDGTGTWSTSFTLGRLYGFPRVTLHAQFAWVDAGLPFGLGLSDCSPIMVPPPTQTRIWAGNTNSGQGNENATTGSREAGYQYALITGFDA